jgi:GTP-binding protein Era
MTPQPEHPFRSGYVAIIGRPNVGKSTLVNRLLNFKLSITTAKPQTTRNRIIGIQTGPDYQIIYLDTPGLLQPSYRLQELMVKAAQQAVRDCDVVLFVTEASSRPLAEDLAILTEVQEQSKPIVLVINKIDMVTKESLLPLMDAYRTKCTLHAIVPLSARTGESAELLEPALVGLLPAGEPFYGPDDVTEHPERFFVAEIIREKIFELFGDEIPYSTAVLIDEFREQEGRKDLIRARIIIERDSQKAIIIGKGGTSLRKIGERSRRDIETFLQRPVFLELWVAVREKWRKKDTFLREMGYYPE